MTEMEAMKVLTLYQQSISSTEVRCLLQKIDKILDVIQQQEQMQQKMTKTERNRITKTKLTTLQQQQQHYGTKHPETTATAAAVCTREEYDINKDVENE
eukprot:CAMPEP_0194437668 /NCGR_PEP_ID=MMETSP0176-20130528/101179_1 /TAXON_ID=216777 /ORGANISM="Proboscia alata, Strain PI-D3" /LENGTH=98 /DNA_ID=CAMNT_0039259143 /DNA_START=9 /DNA_END=302 /DNA_ORIENTATION=+